RHRDAGARAVLRDRARRHVHVERATVELRLVDPELVLVRADPGERDPRRLLHHVAKLSGQDEAVVSLHRGRLDEEDVPAGPGDRQSGRDTGPGRPLGGLLIEALPAESVAHELEVDGDRRPDLARGDPRRRLAQQLPELALELANTGLSRVLGDDRREQTVVDRDLVLEQAVPLALARPEV